MPSFDIVSKVSLHELTNAIDQANREVSTRFDFKDSGAKFEYKDNKITLIAPSKFQVEQMHAILIPKLSKRGIDIKSLETGEIQETLKESRQIITVKQGLEQEVSKKINKMIKDQKMKVQAAIMGDQIRVTGKKRDDLQEVIAMLRKAELDVPVQFENFRD